MRILNRNNKNMWALALIVVLGIAWYWYESRVDKELFRPGSGCVNVHAAEARAYLEAHPETQVLDVRSAAEVSGGTLPSALHVSIGDPAFQQRVHELNKAQPVLVYCAGGFRSRKAAAALKKWGFTNIQHLHRGYESWRMSGFPIE